MNIICFIKIQLYTKNKIRNIRKIISDTHKNLIIFFISL